MSFLKASKCFFFLFCINLHRIRPKLKTRLLKFLIVFAVRIGAHFLARHWPRTTLSERRNLGKTFFGTLPGSQFVSSSSEFLFFLRTRFQKWSWTWWCLCFCQRKQRRWFQQRREISSSKRRRIRCFLCARRYLSGIIGREGMKFSLWSLSGN